MKAYYNEFDKDAAAWLRELIKDGTITDGEVDERSIEDIVPTDLAGFDRHHFFAGIGVWDYALIQAGHTGRVWTGSCPCQPFSAAGKGEGFADERHLWPAWFHLIEVLRPEQIFGEQVFGKHSESWLDLVQDDLEGIGYSIGAIGIPACSVGAPHIRQRLYFVANADKRRRGTARLSRRVSGELSTRRADIALPSSERSASGILAHANGGNESNGNLQRSGEYGQFAEDGGVSVLGNAYGTRSQGHGRSIQEHGATGRQDAGRLDSTAGFWSDAEWLYCRDGKYRPAKPGIFPLVARASKTMVRGSNSSLSFDADDSPEARIMRLRGYGNAINAEVAINFIKAASSVE